MQSHLARVRQRRKRRWQKRRPAILFGVVLGLLQILVLVVGVPLGQLVASPWPAIALSVFFYLLIPALANFLASQQTGDASSGDGTGCLVGGTSMLVITIAAVVLIVLASTLMQPICPPDCPRLPISLSYFLIPGVVAESLGAVFGSVLGGWIGGLLGQRQAARRSGRTAADQTP